MNTLHLCGRIIVGFYFLYNGVNHFLRIQMLSGYAASKGVPLPTIAIIVSGVLLIIGGISLGLGYKPKIGILALILFLLPVTIIMHNFWAISDPLAKAREYINFAKNFALIGFALTLLALPEPWPFSLKPKPEH